MKHFEKNDNIMADWAFLISDYLKSIEASVLYQLFLNAREQLTKAEVKESQAIKFQLGYIKRVIQRTSYKKISSNQEWNSIDCSWVNKPNVGSFWHFR